MIVKITLANTAHVYDKVAFSKRFVGWYNQVMCGFDIVATAPHAGFHIVQNNISCKIKYILIPFSLVAPAKIGSTHICLNCIFPSSAHILSHASAIGQRLGRISI